MTDESKGPEGESESRQRWAKDLQETLDRTGEAVRTAWDATRDSRQSALEAARRTVKELGHVLEQGMDAARERWDTESEGGDSERESESSPPPRPTPEGSGDSGDASPGDRPESA